ncbi:MAG: lysophospholipase [Oscillospiraceae bacterium]|nr:lysophospholipase [Oscillospiraceae bacterium]
MKSGKLLTAAIAAATLLTVPMPVSADHATAPIPNPVISRNCPAYSGSNPATASAGNDEHYFSFWNAQCPDYLAYDLSEVPPENRRVIDAVWYCTSAYDVVGMYVNRNMEPSDYTIEINAAPGGDYPETGWEVVETVSGNALASRQHVVAFDGYNWIRICIDKADDKEGSTAMINFDIHDVSEGVSDSWLFLGDSITAGGMNNCYGTGFATHLHALDERYFPIQENGGIGGITSKDGLEHIDGWLSTYPGRYVSIAYGTNDAWGNQIGAAQYYENTKSMIDKVLALGKVPVLPKIPHAEEPGVADYLDDYNAMIDRLYDEYPEVVPGPDFDAILTEHPEYLSGDGVHPNSEGYEEMRRIWAETMYDRVYQNNSEVTAVKGDANGDGVFDLVDLIALQKYLHLQGTLKNAGNADVYQDGTVDVFDLGLMKRMLL